IAYDTLVYYPWIWRFAGFVPLFFEATMRKSFVDQPLLAKNWHSKRPAKSTNTASNRCAPRSFTGRRVLHENGKNPLAGSLYPLSPVEAKLTPAGEAPAASIPRRELDKRLDKRHNSSNTVRFPSTREQPAPCGRFVRLSSNGVRSALDCRRILHEQTFARRVPR